MPRFPPRADAPLVAALRALPGVPAIAPGAMASLFARAEHHGVAGVLHEAFLRAGVPIPDDLGASLGARALARQMDFEAHLALLERVDGALAAAGIRAVVLKGPLFARRYYETPSARGTTDVDLLVLPTELDAATNALSALGYASEDALRDEWSKREHHHIVLVHPRGLPVELHFHAYRGFGQKLSSEPLLARSAPADGFASLRVLAPEDELVYLAVHAAAHRFGRLAWLYDIRRLIETMSPAAIELAARRAHEWGYARALMLAGALLVDVLGVAVERVEPLGHLDAIRGSLLHAVVAEPGTPIIRSATRFAYASLLADSLAATLRYARSSSAGYARRMLGLPR